MVSVAVITWISLVMSEHTQRLEFWIHKQTVASHISRSAGSRTCRSAAETYTFTSYKLLQSHQHTFKLCSVKGVLGSFSWGNVIVKVAEQVLSYEELFIRSFEWFLGTYGLNHITCSANRRTLSANRGILWVNRRTLSENRGILSANLRIAWDLLSESYDLLRESYDLLRESYVLLRESYDSLRESFDLLRESYDLLSDSYDRMVTIAKFAERILRFTEGILWIALWILRQEEHVLHKFFEDLWFVKQFS